MQWWLRLWERLFGYQPVGRWRLYAPDRDSRSASLPGRIPVPREVARAWRRGAGARRLPFRDMVAYAREFLAERPQHREAQALSRFLQKAPLALQIEEALRDGRIAEAERTLAAIEALDPGDARAGFLRGLCLTHQGNLDAARERFELVAPVMAGEADFHAAYGRYWEARRDAPRAAACYRQALDLEPGHPAALERLAVLGEMVEVYLGTLDAPERAFLPRDAYEGLLEREWRESERGPHFLIERSHFHLRHGQAGLALRAVRLAQSGLGQQAGESSAALPSRPGSSLREDQAAEAVTAQALGAEVPATEGLASEALAAECRALIALERFDEAAVPLAHLERLAPDSAWAASCRGQLLWFRGDRQEAAGAIAVALDRDPNRIEDWRLYLDPEFPRRQGDAISALKAFDKKHPDAYAPKYLLATFMIAQERWAAALEWTEAALQGGANDECLVELTGRFGRAGRDREIGRLVELAGGWRSFLGRDALLRSNVAAAVLRRGIPEAARELWTSVAEEEGLHPRLRLQAREALARLDAGAPAERGDRAGGASDGGVVH
ncbi:MAG: hypothetical protein KAY32_13740 [Candidatus Eisenbacteria sp.]|nr:hypothetical protein [Candidatus Eisenbacteria bacterium]